MDCDVNERQMENCKAILLLVMAAAALSGCAQPKQNDTVDHICLPNADNANAVATAEDVLAKMHFEIEKADANSGFIRTRPLPGAHFFEFWRSDNVGASNALLANIQSIRRTASLTMHRRSDQLCIRCRVNVQQLSMPEHEVTSSSHAYEMFSESTASMQQLTLRAEQKRQMAWLDLARDSQLENEILRRIEKQLITNTKNQTMTGEK